MGKKHRANPKTEEFYKLMIQASQPAFELDPLREPLRTTSSISARLGFESEIKKADQKWNISKIEDKRKKVVDLSIQTSLAHASAESDLDKLSKSLQLGMSSEKDFPREIVQAILKRQTALGEKPQLDSVAFDRLCNDPKFQEALKLTGDSLEAFKGRVDRGRKIFEWLQGLGTENQAKLHKLIEHLIKVSKEIEPPKPVSANNIETLMMLFARSMMGFENMPEEFSHPYFSEVINRTHEQYPKVGKLRDSLALFMDHEFHDALLAFAYGWQKSSFARLEVGHKLAASLCLTDIPSDIEVKPPWCYWSLIVPDGLLWSKSVRVWIAGTNPIFVVNQSGFQPASTEIMEEHAKNNPGPESEHHLRSWGMLQNLIKGACLALSNPDEFKKEHSGSKNSGTTKRKTGEPEFNQARFLLSAPVKVDFREEVRAYANGERKGSSPKVQFLVRGHWRNQAHGPRNSLRKTIWVSPHWKGDENARILLRHTEISEGPEGRNQEPVR